jgi:hypothetical protein
VDGKQEECRKDERRMDFERRCGGTTWRVEASCPKHPLGTVPVSDAPEHDMTKTPTSLGATLRHEEARVDLSNLVPGRWFGFKNHTSATGHLWSGKSRDVNKPQNPLGLFNNSITRPSIIRNEFKDLDSSLFDID